MFLKIGPTQMRGHAKVLEVVELIVEPGDVATVVVAAVLRQIAVGEHVLLGVADDAAAGVVTAVVGGVTVVESVGNGEVEDLVLERMADGVADQDLVAGFEPAAAVSLDGDRRDVASPSRRRR